MKDRVVCLKPFEGKFDVKNGRPSWGAVPVKGEIYTVSGVSEPYNGVIGYSLQELHPMDFWNVDCFRPIDDSFGEWVESTVLKESIYEEALKELTV